MKYLIILFMYVGETKRRQQTPTGANRRQQTPTDANWRQQTPTGANRLKCANKNGLKCANKRTKRRQQVRMAPSGFLRQKWCQLRGLKDANMLEWRQLAPEEV